MKKAIAKTVGEPKHKPFGKGKVQSAQAEVKYVSKKK